MSEFKAGTRLFIFFLQLALTIVSLLLMMIESTRSIGWLLTFWTVLFTINVIFIIRRGWLNGYLKTRVTDVLASGMKDDLKNFPFELPAIISSTVALFVIKFL